MSSTNQPEQLYSREAEEAVIGAVLINPGVYSMIDLDESDFHIRRLGWVWQVFGRLYRNGDPFDTLTISDELARIDKLQEIGGTAYLLGLINNTPTAMHAEAYAETIRDYARRRQWRNLANRIASLAFDKDSSLELEASGIVSELLNAVQSEGAAVHVSKYTERVLEQVIERRANPTDIWGIPTGFADFDRITGGLQSGEILYISGEPGMGKSILAAQAGFQMAEAGHPGSIYSLEMPGTQVVRRRASFDAKLPARDLKTGRIDNSGFEALLAVVQKYDDLPLYMSDSVQWTTASLRADLARLKVQFGIEWFVLDYAYLLQDGRGLSENDRTGMISGYMKAICRSLNLAGIVIHSLNKSGMGAAVPDGEHLRGSGQQFYDTDLLLFLVGSKTPNTINCVFGKGRELENPKQAFELRKLPGFPALGNVTMERSNNGRNLWEFAP